jgi:hypothetical protein
MAGTLFSLVDVRRPVLLVRQGEDRMSRFRVLCHLIVLLVKGYVSWRPSTGWTLKEDDFKIGGTE